LTIDDENGRNGAIRDFIGTTTLLEQLASKYNFTIPQSQDSYRKKPSNIQLIEIS